GLTRGWMGRRGWGRGRAGLHCTFDAPWVLRSQAAGERMGTGLPGGYREGNGSLVEMTRGTKRCPRFCGPGSLSSPSRSSSGMTPSLECPLRDHVRSHPFSDCIELFRSDLRYQVLTPTIAEATAGANQLETFYCWGCAADARGARCADHRGAVQRESRRL